MQENQDSYLGNDQSYTNLRNNGAKSERQYRRGREVDNSEIDEVLSRYS